MNLSTECNQKLEAFRKFFQSDDPIEGKSLSDNECCSCSSENCSSCHH